MVTNGYRWQIESDDIKKAIAEAKAKIKSGQCNDAIVCVTFNIESDDTITVIINPNFIKALRDKYEGDGLPGGMVIINMDEVQTSQQISGLLYSLGFIDGE